MTYSVDHSEWPTRYVPPPVDPGADRGAPEIELPHQHWWEPWRDEAACIDVGVDLFYADSMDTDFESKWSKSLMTQAKAFCAKCPVRVECLEAALREEQGMGKDNRWGVRGGLAPSARLALQAKRDREAQGVAA